MLDRARTFVRAAVAWRRSPRSHEGTVETSATLGRASAIAALKRIFKEGARLVTLLGPPGIGKTSVARAFVEARGMGAEAPRAESAPLRCLGGFEPRWGSRGHR